MTNIQNRAYFVNLACTGVVPTKAMTPHVPVGVQEVVDDVGRALEMGVQMVHLHARDQQGLHMTLPSFNISLNRGR